MLSYFNLMIYFLFAKYNLYAFLTISNFVNRRDIVPFNFVQGRECRALVEIMKAMLGEFAYLSREHGLWNSHVNRRQRVSSLHHSSVMGLKANKYKMKITKILTLSSITLLRVCNSSYVASCLLNLYFSNFLESYLDTDSF